MKMKRLLLIIGGLVLLAAVLCVGGSLLSGTVKGFRMNVPTPTVEATPVGVAVRARGEVVPARWAALSFGASGEVTEWLVSEGQTVAADTVLGKLDTTTLELALEQVQAQLDAAETNLARAEADHERQLTEAQLALQIAQARLSQARARYPALTTAEVNLQAAIEVEQRAAVEYDKAVNRPWDPPEVTEGYRLALEQTTDAREIAQANYDAARAEQAASNQELTILDAEVQRAQIVLERLQEGTDPSLEQAVASAQLQVERAEQDLANATLVAPFGGTIVALHLKLHDTANPGVPALTLADLTSLRVETTDLDEWGAAKIQVGDRADITFTAFDDKTLTGHVTEIALRGEKLPAGDIVYRAVITLDAPDPDLRWGMTVRISIPIEE